MTYASGSAQPSINLGSAEGGALAPAGIFQASFTQSSDPPFDMGSLQAAGGSVQTPSIAGLVRNIDPGNLPSLVFSAPAAAAVSQTGASAVADPNGAAGTFILTFTLSQQMPAIGEIEPITVWLENPGGASQLIGGYTVEGT